MESIRNFNVSKILKLQKKNEQKDSSIIDWHYKRLIWKVKDASDRYEDHVYYNVDHFVSKLPMYDSTEVAQNLVKKMKSQNFTCRVVYQNQIYIWWKAKRRPQDHIPVLLNEIFNKIERHAKEGHDQCFIEVPLFLSGYPWYDSVEVTSNIAHTLSDRGFIVKIFENSNILYVSWKQCEIEHRNKVKIKFETNEEKRMKALKKINYINEQRYKDFINPRKTKKSIDGLSSYSEGLNSLKKDLFRINNR